MKSPLTPRALAEHLFLQALRSVDSATLTSNHLGVDGQSLIVGDRCYPKDTIDRVVVVGAGKAGAGMVSGVEATWGGIGLPIEGLVNVPDDCVRPTQSITLVGARPAGRNEPTPRGVAATERILDRVATCGPRDLCLVLISGGGSALLPSPIDGLTLEAKREAVAMLAASGADIQALNTVRRKLSRVKGGGLLRACHCGYVETLIISDVIGDDLATIASGPTVVADDPTDAAEKIFRDHVEDVSCWPEGLEAALTRDTPNEDLTTQHIPSYHNTIIGSNAVAIGAAVAAATKAECDVVNLGGGHTGEAADVGRAWAQRLVDERATRAEVRRPLILIDGGEPVVTMAETTSPRKGGRNQEVVLAAIEELRQESWERIALLSGGTDGEDGPTDAAGAIADQEVVLSMREQQLDVHEFLSINNSYPFFEHVGGLIKTGPTHTNVMDIRIGVVWPD